MLGERDSLLASKMASTACQGASVDLSLPLGGVHHIERCRGEQVWRMPWISLSLCSVMHILMCAAVRQWSRGTPTIAERTYTQDEDEECGNPGRQ